MFFSRGVNKVSLDIIEKAAFVVVLDDIPYEYDEVSENKFKMNIILSAIISLSNYSFKAP